MWRFSSATAQKPSSLVRHLLMLAAVYVMSGRVLQLSLPFCWQGLETVCSHCDSLHCSLISKPFNMNLILLTVVYGARICAIKQNNTTGDSHRSWNLAPKTCWKVYFIAGVACAAIKQRFYCFTAVLACFIFFCEHPEWLSFISWQPGSIVQCAKGI